MLNSTRGGAKETELNELMVVPRNWPSVPCNALGMSVVCVNQPADVPRAPSCRIAQLVQHCLD